MNQTRSRSLQKTLLRAVIEIGFIIFLFYSNLLMGEFTASGAAHEKSLAFAVHDVLTLKNFVIANLAAFVGYGVVEFLRKQL